MSSKGFSTTPGLDGALVKAKDPTEARWGTIGTCFGMLGTDYVLVMFEEFNGYVVAVPVAEFAEHYCLLPHTLEGNRGGALGGPPIGLKRAWRRAEKRRWSGSWQR